MHPFYQINYLWIKKVCMLIPKLNHNGSVNVSCLYQENAPSNLLPLTEDIKGNTLEEIQLWQLLMTRICTFLIPLFVDNNHSPTNKIERVLLDNAAFLKDKRETKLSDILKMKQVIVSLQLHDWPTLCPTLNVYWISLEDKRLHESVLRDLTSL